MLALARRSSTCLSGAERDFTLRRPCVRSVVSVQRRKVRIPEHFILCVCEESVSENHLRLQTGKIPFLFWDFHVFMQHLFYKYNVRQCGRTNDVIKYNNNKNRGGPGFLNFFIFARQYQLYLPHIGNRMGWTEEEKGTDMLMKSYA